MRFFTFPMRFECPMQNYWDFCGHVAHPYENRWLGGLSSLKWKKNSGIYLIE